MKNERLWALFHKLWGRDQDHASYDKSQWMELESLILNLPENGAEKPLVDRITEYLATGGLFNPELADHTAVRDLLIDCRKQFS